MHDRVKLSGWVVGKAPLATADDVRALAAWLNYYNISSDTEIDVERGTAWIDIVGQDSVECKWIECGDHIPPACAHDVIIPTHAHVEGGPSMPAKFDWPAKDRSK